MGEAAAWAFIVPSTSSPVKQSYRSEKQPFYDVEVLELGKVTNVIRETGRLVRSKRIEANARIAVVQSQTMRPSHWKGGLNRFSMGPGSF